MAAEATIDLSQFIAGWELFRDPVLTGVIAGALLGALGVYVVLRRMVFMSAALSQSAGLGVTLAFYAQIFWGVPAALASPTLGALLATAAATLLLLSDTGTSSRRDGLLGLTYLIGAAGTLAVSTRIVQQAHDVESILFGTAVAVVREDFHLVLGAGVIIGALQVWWARGFIESSFDPDGARVRGLPVRLLEATLLASLAVAISLGTRVLGALPVFAFSILPAMAAVRLSVNVPRALVIAAVLGGASGFLGYLVAFLHQLPVGASQAGVGALFVGLAELARPVVRWRRYR